MIAVANRTRQTPNLPWSAIADQVLGPDYDLSLVLLGTQAATALNRRTRGQAYTPNVLSWPLSSHSGEMILVPTVARREAPTYGHTAREHLLYLFIHGLLHLKGLDHGSKMDGEETRLLRLFATNGKTHHRRTRHRH